MLTGIKLFSLWILQFFNFRHSTTKVGVRQISWAWHGKVHVLFNFKKQVPFSHVAAHLEKRLLPRKTKLTCLSPDGRNDGTHHTILINRDLWYSSKHSAVSRMILYSGMYCPDRTVSLWKPRLLHMTSNNLYGSKFVERWSSLVKAYLHNYDNYPIFKYWDKQAWANSVDPDQTPQNKASDLGLHCLPLIQQCLGSQWIFFCVLGEVW